MNEAVCVIAIDGPSGSGKGTIARRVAEALGFHLLDSGALYRLTALSAAKNGVSLDDTDKLAALARNLDVQFDSNETGEERIWLDGEDVSIQIRTEETGSGASTVAAIPAVRQALLVRQRAFQQPPGLVADGRDMGTHVFPSAAVNRLPFQSASPPAAAHSSARPIPGSLVQPWDGSVRMSSKGKIV